MSDLRALSQFPWPRSRAQRITVAGTAAVWLYAVWAAVELLVLRPLAVAPGSTLPQVYQAVAAAGNSLDIGLALGILAVGPVVAVLLLVGAYRPGARPTAYAVAYLLLLALGAPAFFVASFGPGIGLADTYGVSGGDYSPAAILLYVVSGLAVLAPIAVLLKASPRSASPARS